MNYPIDDGSRRPAYLQLYDHLKNDITDGTYPYGSRLPSKRTIAQDTGVSVITAEHALSLLAEEGYVEPRERSGCFVIYRSHDFRAGARHEGVSGTAAAHASDEGTHAAPQASDVPRTIQPYMTGDFPYSVLAKTVRKVLSDYGELLLVRSPNHGSETLRAEISSYLARSRSIHVSPSQIIVGSGAEYLYGLIAQFFGRDTVFALEDPSYHMIRRVYESFGIVCDLLPLRKDGIDTQALRRTKAAVLHTTPFHNYPTGITYNVSKKREILSWAAGRSAVVVEDNYDSELTVSVKPEDSLFSIARGVNVIYVNTFTRTIAPSLRVGYMVLPEALEKAFNERLGFYSCTVPLLDQYVLAELLRSGDFERHINRVRRKRRREQQP